MTNKWTEGDLAALDDLLGKYPLTEIVAKAKRGKRRKAGRPPNSGANGMQIFMAIEVARARDQISVSRAAEKVAALISQKWKKPISAKSLMRLHREFSREISESARNAWLFPHRPEMEGQSLDVVDMLRRVAKAVERPDVRGLLDHWKHPPDPRDFRSKKPPQKK